MASQPLKAVMRRLFEIIEFVAREKRLPAKLSENYLMQCFSFLKRYIVCQFTPTDSKEVVVVYLPHLRHRYVYQILHLSSLIYPRVIFLWNFNLKNYIKLGHEGRRLFTIKNLKIVSSASSILQPTALINTNSSDSQTAEISPLKLHIIIEPDLSQQPCQDSLLLPYGVHPAVLEKYDQFNQAIPLLRSKKREISIFFSGAVGVVGDKHLVERYFNVPSRDRCMEFLVERSDHLNICIIEHFRERKQFVAHPEKFKHYAAVLCTCKGLPEKWLVELSSANFFLALPGCCMLMCHNVIEAMAVGTIPILSYEDWFSPSLVHGKNCLVYKCLEELPELIAVANQMEETSITTMKESVIDYYEHYLNPLKIAKFIQTYQGSKLHLFINHEDAESLHKVTDDSILRLGGSLQPLL